MAGMSANQGLLLRGEPGRADDGLDAELLADRQMQQRALGPGEVDQHIGIRQTLVQIVGDQHTAGMTQKGTRVLPQRVAARLVQSTSQTAICCRHHRFDQHVPHAT